MDADRTRRRRALWASFVGTGIEFYDFYIYATAASLVFGQIFFPPGDPGVQQMAAFATLGVAFFARPFGAAVFGHYGDRIGRKATLVASLLTMGLSTTLVAFLPTYEAAGWVAPFALCLLRFGQGFGLGGEWGGAALLAVENAPPGWRARFGSAPQMGAPAGFIAANGLFLVLLTWMTPEQFADWGWRIPFALSAALVLVGLWVRLKLGETPEFKACLAEAPPAKVPLGEVVGRHGGVLIGGTIGAVCCFATYYIATAFLLGWGTKSLGYAKGDFLGVQLVAILFMAAGIYLAAWAADSRWDPRRVLAGGCVMVAASGFVIAPLMGAGLVGVFAFLSLLLFAMGFVYGPLSAWLTDLFPPRVRYTGVSMAFNIAGVIGGGLTPVIAQKLAMDHGLMPVGWYLSAAGALSLVALLALKGRDGAQSH
ncbi:MHS family MFS transporter [Sphingomonas suaedae]|uniref:MHS family MFS transporter n=1 Tax=Sphingomonas suaedae TaxID=2599297 RepID=A0A518RDM6_9SPHN|nr:MFS transporter [Sphingomonas suaedae]QDX25491.1 MHS family MFS transporter [Sphingomonas suaedae]